MIPLGRFTDPALPSDFISPYDEDYNPIEEATVGGLAIGDGSAGRRVQRWTYFYAGGSINVIPEVGPIGWSMVMPGVETLSGAFDNNMRPVVAYQKADGAYLYRYDEILEDYNTISILNATSSRCVVDDTRDVYNADSDVIWGYILDGNLYYRQQRDRFTIPYLIGPAPYGKLVRVAMNVNNRLQFKVDPRL